jgi:intein/homing endonuclease
MTIDFSTHADKLFSPVFKSVYKAKKRFVVVYGGAGCFTEKQLIITDKGYKKISKIKIGDNVLSYNGIDNEFKKVNDVFKYKNNKKTLRIKLSNGKIIEATEDHKFYYGGAWVQLKDIVSLWHERNIQTNP